MKGRDWAPVVPPFWPGARPARSSEATRKHLTVSTAAPYYMVQAGRSRASSRSFCHRLAPTADSLRQGAGITPVRRGIRKLYLANGISASGSCQQSVKAGKIPLFGFGFWRGLNPSYFWRKASTSLVEPGDGFQLLCETGN